MISTPTLAQICPDTRLREALGSMDRFCDGLNSEERDRFALALAAGICERVAYSKAGQWSSGAVADLLIIAAQVERFARRNRYYD